MVRTAALLKQLATIFVSKYVAWDNIWPKRSFGHKWPKIILDNAHILILPCCEITQAPFSWRFMWHTSYCRAWGNVWAKIAEKIRFWGTGRILGSFLGSNAFVRKYPTHTFGQDQWNLLYCGILFFLCVCGKSPCALAGKPSLGKTMTVCTQMGLT